MNPRQLDLPGLLGVTDDLDDGGAQAYVHDRGELHVHMNGAVPVSTIREIMADEATSFPTGFDVERDMTRLAPCQSLAEYLSPWQVLRLFPKNAQTLTASPMLFLRAWQRTRSVSLNSAAASCT